MKKLTLFALFCFAVVSIDNVKAQDLIASNPDKVNSTHSVSKLPEMSTLGPRFKGGNEALKKYIAEQVVYPEIDKKLGREGTVLVEYYINQDGKLENISIIKSISSSLDQEAMRLIKNMPNWEPGLQNGRAVKVKYQLPVKFELSF